jgi:hypothetical protein
MCQLRPGYGAVVPVSQARDMRVFTGSSSRQLRVFTDVAQCYSVKNGSNTNALLNERTHRTYKLHSARKVSFD